MLLSPQVGIPVADITSALSFALDLTEDSVPGHALRTCLLGMRLAAAAGLEEGLRCDLYYALMLKDVGCSSNAGRLHEIIASDERWLKRSARFEDWTKPSLKRLQMLWKHLAPGAPLLSRTGRLTGVLLHQKQNNQEMFALRCERGAAILRSMGHSEQTARAVRHVDEHWQGSGFPDKLRGDQIPLLSRILRVAQHLDVFGTGRGSAAALSVLKERSGRSFDPSLVQLACDLDAQEGLWHPVHEEEDLRKAVLAMEPGRRMHASEAGVDAICNGFAEVVDVKSSFTGSHSRRVATTAMAIARQMQLAPERMQLVSRASLLHDLGKLRVPNSILDKDGQLTLEERQIVEEHPALTEEILGRVGPFAELARVAGQHHEKLDGSGYPRRLRAADLSIEARLIAVADVYCALAEDRPYRPGLNPQQIRQVMDTEAGPRLDRDCYDALLAAIA